MRRKLAIWLLAGLIAIGGFVVPILIDNGVSTAQAGKMAVDH